MRKIGMYRKTFPLISETFIRDQASHLSRYHPVFITCRKLEDISFDSISIDDNDFLGIKQALYLLTRSPELFGNSSVFDELSLIHGHFGTDSVYAMAIAEKLKIPFLVSFYGYDVSISYKTIWKSKVPLAYQLLLHEKGLKEKASAFLVNSRFMREQLIEKGYPEKKVIQHYLGTDLSKLFPSNILATERYILCVGRHTEKKGIDTLLRAFSRIANKFPEVSLIQIGSGHLTQELHDLASKLNISHRVRFLGSQPYEKVQELTRSAEIFALPSQTAQNGDSEGLPCVVIEASACGVPVVSTWHSGIPEAVLDSETGFLVAEKDDKALAEKLEILLSDPALSKRFGQRGREHVCEIFDLQKQVLKLELIYDSIMS